MVAQLAVTAKSSESAKFHTVRHKAVTTNMGQKDPTVELVPKISKRLEVTHHGQILYIFHATDILPHIIFQLTA